MVEVRNLTWRPAGRPEPVLHDFDLRLEPGEKTLLAGPSGSGKSTLLRAIAGLLLTADVGDLSGQVRLDGRPPQERPGQVGLLLQDPVAAVVSSRVGRDVAFGLENTRVLRAQMPALVEGALAAARFPYGVDRRTGSLSGGESQRLALAGALALRPRVLLLDEPTAMLDQEAAQAVRRSVLDVAAETGATLVVVEHRIEPWVEAMDRCVVLDENGAVCADGAPADVLLDRGEALARRGVWVPGLPAPEPLLVDPALAAPRQALNGDRPVVNARGLEVRYRSPFGVERDTERLPAALTGVGCDLVSGRSLVLRGPSGAGKSTLLAVLAGLQRPDGGNADIHPVLAGRRGRAVWRLGSRELARSLSWVPQTSEHGLVARTVTQELLVTSRALAKDAATAEQSARELAEAEERARGLLDVLALAPLADASVHSLSGGEQRRLVVAAALVHGPAGVLLDEPTVGQDRVTWSAVVGLCRSALGAGAAVAAATHDPFAVASLGAPALGEVLTLEGGRVAAGSRP